MITGKTASGFEFRVCQDALNNMELVDALDEADQGNALAWSRVVRNLLGKEQREALYDHLRSADGIVTVDAVSAAVMDILKAIPAGKK